MTPSKPSLELFDMLTNKGWVGKIDWLMLALTVSWPFLAHFGLHLSLVVTLLVSILIVLTWLLVLAYRIAYFIIIIQVMMDSMPATASRLAVKFLKQVPTNLPSGA